MPPCWPAHGMPSPLTPLSSAHHPHRPPTPTPTPPPVPLPPAPWPGFGTALLGKSAAMACTVAVEEVISEHYNDQIRMLLENGYTDEELKEVCMYACMDGCVFVFLANG